MRKASMFPFKLRVHYMKEANISHLKESKLPEHEKARKHIFKYEK